ncbi:MAG: FeoA domain-containing protein [Kiritimatiellia bacterium]
MRFGFFFRHRCRRGADGLTSVRHLADGFEDVQYRILENPDRQSREMGFSPGMEVQVLRNVDGEHGLVVAAGTSRYVVARQAAAAIRIEPAG